LAVHELDFDVNQFADWLGEQTGARAELTIAPTRGGGSCEMFRMTRGGEDWMIRRAPRAVVSDTAHNVVREYKIIKALSADPAVPVPEVLAASADRELIGAPFFIMKFIDGHVISRELPADYLEHPEQHPQVGFELVDKAAALHAFDWKNSEIASLAKPEHFLERQVERWMGQLAGYRNRDLPGVDAVAKWLDDNRPARGDLAVMHGDYKLDNVMFSKQVPPRMVSILDFEMTTVGDPLIDIAWAMIFWCGERSGMPMAPPGSKGGISAEHCPTSEQLVQRYAERTGRDIGNFQWYQVFAAWKLAIVLEASYAKHLSGQSKNPLHQYFGHQVDRLLARARAFAAV